MNDDRQDHDWSEGMIAWEYENWDEPKKEEEE